MALASPASGALVLNFNDFNSGQSPGFGFSGGGNLQGVFATNNPTGGVGGSGGLQIAITTPTDPPVGGAGGGILQSQINLAGAPGIVAGSLTQADLNKINVSFDAILSPTSSGISNFLRIETFGGGSTALVVDPALYSELNSTTFTTIAFSLGDFDSTNFLTAANDNNDLMFQMAFNFLPTAAGPFPEGSITFDNLRVTAVPEPSTFAMVGLAAAGLLVSRRRAKKA